jgi:serine/threonine protein kinase
MHRIRRGDITIGKSLGKGGCAEVFEGTRPDGSSVAVKQLFDGLTQKSRTAFQRELSMMHELKSEFVVDVHGFVDESPEEPMLLVMERMHEPLSSAYISDPAPSLRTRVEWLVQAGKAISFFHKQLPPILHRDIKPANMLISSPATGRRLKMSDFGMSKSLADITSSRFTSTTASESALPVGTVPYMAPELMSMKPQYSPASDVFAFGVVCWELICMRLPFKDCRNLHFIVEGVRDRKEREDFELEDCPDFVFPPALKAMIERAWAHDPKERPAIDRCVFELEQFLAQSPLDTSGIKAPAHNAGGHGQHPRSLDVHVSQVHCLPRPLRAVLLLLQRYSQHPYSYNLMIL